MEGVEAVEVEKLYAFVRAFFGTHLSFHSFCHFLLLYHQLNLFTDLFYFFIQSCYTAAPVVTSTPMSGKDVQVQLPYLSLGNGDYVRLVYHLHCCRMDC